MALHAPRLASLLLLLAASLALSAGQKWNPLNDIFRQRHVDYPRSLGDAKVNDYCDKMMWDRVMYTQPSNTFINEPHEKIAEVCSTKGRVKGPYRYRSNDEFNITVCIFNPFTFSYSGLRDKRIIILSCWKRLPALYIKHV